VTSSVLWHIWVHSAGSTYFSENYFTAMFSLHWISVLLISVTFYTYLAYIIFSCDLAFKCVTLSIWFLCATAATAVARLSHCSSVCPSVCPSHGWISQKTVQARITKISPLAAWKTLVSGTVKFFHKFEGDHPKRGC